MVFATASLVFETRSVAARWKDAKPPLPEYKLTPTFHLRNISQAHVCVAFSLSCAVWTSVRALPFAILRRSANKRIISSRVAFPRWSLWALWCRPPDARQHMKMDVLRVFPVGVCVTDTRPRPLAALWVIFRRLFHLFEYRDGCSQEEWTSVRGCKHTLANRRRPRARPPLTLSISCSYLGTTVTIFFPSPWVFAGVWMFFFFFIFAPLCSKRPAPAGWVIFQLHRSLHPSSLSWCGVYELTS